MEPSTSPAVFGLLGLLASRSWTGYELTSQVRRSLRFVWPVSEAHLYREQRRLVTLGWATCVEESAGQRTRKRYTITAAGREALHRWLDSEPEQPQFHIEGLLRVFNADRSTPTALVAASTATARAARESLAELAAIADEYLDPGGPMELLERGEGGADDRREFHGRPVLPERLPVVAITLGLTSELLEHVDRLFSELAAEASTWHSLDELDRAETRRHLAAVVSRSRRSHTDVRSGAHR
jgi:PadR family transcriptional regulator, regulatory protein AphA